MTKIIIYAKIFFVKTIDICLNNISEDTEIEKKITLF